jgi:hypothetical protein
MSDLEKYIQLEDQRLGLDDDDPVLEDLETEIDCIWCQLSERERKYLNQRDLTHG